MVECDSMTFVAPVLWINEILSFVYGCEIMSIYPVIEDGVT